MMKKLTPQEAATMRVKIQGNTDSFIEFALAVARATGDQLAASICIAEQERRITRAVLANVDNLGAIPTMKD